jgi:hypothetical protein
MAATTFFTGDLPNLASRLHDTVANTINTAQAIEIIDFLVITG